MNSASFSTSSLAGGERAGYWASLVCDTFVELDCRIPEPDRFHGKIESSEAGELKFFHIVSSAHEVTRTRSRIARSRQDDFLLSLQTAGRGTVSQDGREAVVGIGDFAIFDTTQPYDLRFDHDFAQIVIRLPRELITAKVADIDRLTARAIAGNRGIGKVASTYIQQLHSELGEIDPIYLPRMHGSVIDLIATAVADQLDVSERSTERHVMLRRRVSAYIDRNLADADLTCESIAAKHGISARHLSKVFGEAKMRVSQLIWNRRLEQARRDLADPLCRHVSITGVCYDAGFKDAAHFSRLFKSAFGETPSAFRARIQCDD
jgi:AraC-like DNA-binding protein